MWGRELQLNFKELTLRFPLKEVDFVEEIEDLAETKNVASKKSEYIIYTLNFHFSNIQLVEQIAIVG